MGLGFYLNIAFWENRARRFTLALMFRCRQISIARVLSQISIDEFSTSSFALKRSHICLIFPFNLILIGRSKGLSAILQCEIALFHPAYICFGAFLNLWIHTFSFRAENHGVCPTFHFIFGFSLWPTINLNQLMNCLDLSFRETVLFRWIQNLILWISRVFLYSTPYLIEAMKIFS